MVILDLGYLEETSEKSQFTLNVVGGSQVYTDATADNNTAEAVAAGIGDLVYVGVKVYANPDVRTAASFAAAADTNGVQSTYSSAYNANTDKQRVK